MSARCVSNKYSSGFLSFACTVFLTSMVFLTTSSFAQAQEERYELGKRLRRFEVAWQVADREGRVRCVAPMQEAVQSFFGLRLSAAARELDQAYFAVRSAESPTDFERFAISRRLSFGRALIDASQASVEIKLQPFYKVEQPPPADAAVQIEVRSADGVQVVKGEFKIETLSVGAALDISQLGEGDFSITATATNGAEKILFAQSLLSKVRDVKARLDKLDGLLKERGSKEPSVVQSTDVLTCKQLLRTMRAQTDGISGPTLAASATEKGQVQEIDYPALQLLRMCEAMLVEEVDSVTLFGKLARQQDVWMTLSDTKKQVSVRLRCPEKATKPMPVLFALHGAGGSENMFFETYGAGRVVELATQRGWMVVAPRQGLLGLNLSCRGMLDVLAKYYDIDPDQVYLVGHSMGAAQVMRQVAIDADLPAAAVAIGGGGRIANAEKYAGFPWLVAAGEFDFGRGGAKALADSLKQRKVDVRFSEYPDVEHMVIVQAALDDVFKFFDEVQSNK